MQRFDLTQIPHTPWKNGGGSTREIVCFPPDANMNSFAWRISVATIALAGPFSTFPGIDRHIMLLVGDGVHLHSADGQIDHLLDQAWQPFSFSGEAALDCDLLGGTSTDFNVMARRGQWTAQLNVLASSATAGLSAAGLCMVLQGSWQLADGQALQTGQGLWWSTAKSTPLTPQSPDAKLILVSLQPQI